jgi:L,D-transpeptidase ErfK/SrfK
MRLASRLSAVRLRAFLAAALLAGLAGCGLLAPPPGPQPDPEIALTAPHRWRPAADSDLVGHLYVTLARGQDTLPDIARAFDLGHEEIVAANPGVEVWLPGEGTQVVLPTAHILPDAPRRGLVLNLAAMRLFHLRDDGIVITHPVGIGREGWATPEGRNRIVSKREDPSWYVPASVRAESAREGNPLPAVVPPGPGNPLGRHALRLSRRSYLIHGTNRPFGVGMRVSHGCIRLYPEDIARLYPQVPVGTEVTIVSQPYLAGWRDGMLYLEAHPLLEEQQRAWGEDSLDQALSLLRAVAGDAAERVDWARAERIAGAARGIPLPVLAGSPSPEEVIAAAPRVRNPPHAPPPEGSRFARVGVFAR